MHIGFVLGDEGGDLDELGVQVEFHVVLSLAFLALHLAGDGFDLERVEVVECVCDGAFGGGPWVRRWDVLGLGGVASARRRLGLRGGWGEGESNIVCFLAFG